MLSSTIFPVPVKLCAWVICSIACPLERMNGQDCMEFMHCQQHALIGSKKILKEVVLADTSWEILRPRSAM